MKDTLVIKNLYAQTIDGKEILKGVSLSINKGEIHALMGPNGGGKSTLAQVLMGHPGYVVTKGTVLINDIDVTNMPPDQKARQGLFLGFQYPVEVAGVNFAHFLRMVVNERLELRIKNQELRTKKISPIAFRKQMQGIAEKLALGDITKRNLNEGFSGGEKKKAEILQLAVVRPNFAILDEPDSGLDVDALRYIGKTIEILDYRPGLLLITHYQRILGYIKPDFVHVLVDGKIILSGDVTLAREIEEKGYEEYL